MLDLNGQQNRKGISSSLVWGKRRGEVSAQSCSATRTMQTAGPFCDLLRTPSLGANVILQSGLWLCTSTIKLTECSDRLKRTLETDTEASHQSRSRRPPPPNFATSIMKGSTSQRRRRPVLGSSTSRNTGREASPSQRLLWRSAFCRAASPTR